MKSSIKPTDDNKNAARTLTLMQYVFIVMLSIFGVTLLHEGVCAIRDRAYTFRYTERTQAVLGGVVLQNDVVNGALEFRGRTAVVFGTGFCALGTMLLTWVAGIMVNMFARFGRKAPRAVVRSLSALSLLALLIGCLTLMPPWRLHMLPLYLVVTSFVLAIALPIPAAWRKKVFPGAVICIFLVSYINFPAFPVFAGIFVALVFGANLLTLWPSLGKRIDARLARTRHETATPPEP